MQFISGLETHADTNTITSVYIQQGVEEERNKHLGELVKGFRGSGSAPNNPNKKTRIQRD